MLVCSQVSLGHLYVVFSVTCSSLGNEKFLNGGGKGYVLSLRNSVGKRGRIVRYLCALFLYTGIRNTSRYQKFFGSNPTTVNIYNNNRYYKLNFMGHYYYIKYVYPETVSSIGWFIRI